MAQHSERAAFLVQGDGASEQIVDTGGQSGWKRMLNHAYQPIPITRAIVPAF
jgi:hypothetical protein